VLDYDPSRTALYSPEQRDTLFVSGKNFSILQIAIESSRLAYIRAEQSASEQQRLADALSCIGFDAPALFADSETNSQAFGAYRPVDATALIAFRGTQPDAVEDLITDLKFRLVDWPEAGGRVHEGFAAAFRSLRPQIDHWLETAGAGRGQLILTGHSLGAALATLATSVWKPAQLLTLGSPRVGDATFATLFAAQSVVRLVDCCDLVTDVPLEIGGYRHVGPATYVTRNGEVVENPRDKLMIADRLQADFDYLLRYAPQLGKNVSLRRLADHAPINYARAFFQ
jgi:hypothetical protein